jgi:glycosyltransferase involved in cell wall biosynthesis
MKKINNKDIKVSLIIPVYNNSATLSKYLEKCIIELQSSCNDYEILISNDNSFDKTQAVLEKFQKNINIKLFHQKNNLGIARNLLFLYKKALNPYVVLFSLDGDWDPHDISRLIMYAKNNNTDIVIGKRDGKTLQFNRRIVSAIYNLMPLILFGVKTYDTGSIKILKKEIIDTIPLHLKSVSFEAELFIKAIKKGYTIAYLPVHFKKHKDNKQSSVNLKLIAQSFLDLIRLRLQ